jgi:hypothetical protein
MQLPLISELSKELKTLITAFVIVLSVGFYSGIRFVNETDSHTASGVYENYLGNEENENAEVFKFKKTNREMISIVHSHIISMALIFLSIGGLLSMVPLGKKLKYFITIEPFVSIILTFGGIYLMWMGIEWMRYIVIVSGILMTLCYTAAVVLILKHTLVKSK